MTGVLVTGAGGFIGGHLVRRLLEEGHVVRAGDRKPSEHWYQLHTDAENLPGIDASERSEARRLTQGMEAVYNLAADMGGMGFIERHKTACMLSVLITSNVLEQSLYNGVERFFFSSSACVYPQDRQAAADVKPLAEHEAYPAQPEDGYGWEKLFGEQMCRIFREEHGMATRVARYHNVYGPHGTWDGDREKAPAAICRKVAAASLSGRHQIEIWGDGEQTRSFAYIDDCVEGTRRIMDSEILDPINLGSDRLVSINQLVSMVEEIAGVRLDRRYLAEAPQGVRGRNSDNTKIQKELGWQPSIPLRDGLERTYAWIHDQMRAQGRGVT